MKIGLSLQFSLTILLLIILGVVYLTTLLPGVGFSGDSAELQFMGKILSIPHPTGYPIYILINFIFTSIFPFGSLAFKVNLLSSIFSLLAVVFLFRILICLEVDKYLSFITSLTFGFTYTFWLHSIVAEVYSLHVLFLSIVLYYFIKWNKTGLNKFLLLGCFFYALSFGNHLTMITLLPGIIFIVWAKDKTVFRNTKTISIVILFIFLGVSQYLFLLWRSYNPGLPFSQLRSPDVKTFVQFITGGHFKSRMFAFSFGEILNQRMPLLITFLIKEYLVILPLSIYGIFSFKNKNINIFLLVYFVSNIIYAINYDIVDIYIYFLPNYFILAIYLGICLNSFSASLPKRSIAIFLFIPAFIFIHNFKMVNQHNKTSIAEEVESVLESVDSNALIIPSDWENAGYFLYYLIGENIQNTKNIYVLVHHDRNSINNYLSENESIILPEQGITVPKDLDIYSINTQYKGDFKLLKVKENLYKMVKR